MSGLKFEIIWKIIRKHRLKYFIENIDTISTTSYQCFSTTGSIWVMDVGNTGSNFDAIERQLKKLGSNHTNNDIDNRTLHNIENGFFETAGEMFIYVNLCPKFLFDWIKLYVDMLQSSSPDVIVQTLNNIMITSKTRKYDTIVDMMVHKLFEKMMFLFSLKFPTIDRFHMGNQKNQSKSENPIKPFGKKRKKFLENHSIINTLSEENLLTASNHPVHLYDEKGKLSPSAFIPFCAFGRNRSSMGVMIEPYELPVCNSFRDKIFNNQHCYEVDLNQYADRNNIEEDLKSGLVFFMDYNEGRQVTPNNILTDGEHKLFVDMVDGSRDEKEAAIYLNAIGITSFKKL